MLRWLVPVLGLAGCAHALPEPEHADHPPGDFIEVPYPPPAALVETVPPRPKGDFVWVDGYWNWARTQFVWQRGGWVPAREAARLAPWVSHYTNDGRILFAKDVWFDRDGRVLHDPEPAVPAYTPPNEITGEFQTPR